MKPTILVLLLALAPLARPSAAAPVRSAATEHLQDGKTLEELERDVQDSDGRKRRTAVRRLAELGGEAAWELVVGRLTDEDAQVADEAQIRLAQLEDAELWRELALGRQGLGAKEPLVRRRVAEAMGRCATLPFGVEGLLDALGDKDAEVRRLAAWSCERLAIAGVLGALTPEQRGELVDAFAKISRTDKDGSVQGAAVVANQAVCATEPDRVSWGTEFAEKRLESRDAEERVGALIALGRVRDAERADEIAGLVQQLAEDPALAVRIEVVKSLAAMRTRAGAAALVGVLERTQETSLAIRIAEELQRLSGLRHRTDPRPWRDWVDGLPEGWTPGPVAEPEEITVTKLVGLPIRSERLSLLIDMSGSMWQSRPDGNKTKDLVDVEVRRCLEGLPRTARFNLVPYATEPDPYAKELVEASPKKVEKAQEWFVDNDLRGKGNVWDAVLVALDDPDVDTLVVMTDGAPTGGPHWNLDLMVPLLLERNRYRNVVFDVVLTESKDNLLPHWKKLAAESGGRCVEVDFDE